MSTKYFILIIIAVLISSCDLSNITIPGTARNTSTPIINSSTQKTETIQLIEPAGTSTLIPTYTQIIIPSLTPTLTTTSTKTPYPIPEDILSNEEMQQRIDDWTSGKIILQDSERLLDEKTGKPLRLSILDKPILGQIIFNFYNLGYIIIEDEKGTPYLLNILGFEDGNGSRFTFPFHLGKLFAQEPDIILQEFKGKRINMGEKIYYKILTPEQILQKSKDLIGYINIGFSTIGNPGYGRESDIYMETSQDITSELTNFLLCNTCLITDTPNNLKKYINQIPQKYEPTIPYIWEYEVAY